MGEKELDSNSENFIHSSLRESIIEHIFVGQILKELWRRKRFQVETLKPQVDNSGYDLAIECPTDAGDGHSILWHIQLKASHAKAKRTSVNVAMKLTQKPNWCVIWIFFNAENLEFEQFLWFGTETGKTRPDISALKTTKHTRGDKKERPGLREVRKTRFVELKSIEKVVDQLFSEAK